MNTLLSLALALVGLFSVDAFTQTLNSPVDLHGPSTSLMAVADVDGEAKFDEIVKGAGSSLVVVDYSTTW